LEDGYIVKISVIILTWNSEKYIEKCINSLKIDNNIEIIIVDNGSTDSTLEIVKKYENEYELQVIKLDKNYGTTKPRNIAISKCKGDYIFFIDSDTEIRPNTLNSLKKVFENEKNVGMVAPRLRYPDGKIQPSCKRFPTILTKIMKFLPFEFTHKVALKDELYSDDFDELTEVDYCISAAWMVSKKAVDDIGFFDENIFYSPEDVDYCLRMWEKGWKVLYNPKIEVVHHAQRVSYNNCLFTLSHIKGLIYYFKKHGYWFNRKKLYDNLKEFHERGG